MHGTPLTPNEAVAAVRRKVEWFERAGLARQDAVVAAGATLRIDPLKIAAVVDAKESA